MKEYIYEGKTEDEALNLALYELNLTKDDIFYKVKEEKKGLFKAKKYEVIITKKEDYINKIKDILIDILDKMGIKDIKLEVLKNDEHIYINIFAEDEYKPILIGKGGKNLAALNQIIRQMLNNMGVNLKVNIDTGSYKKDRERRIASLARKLARDVARTKVEVTMDPMNSYERRIVHNALSNNKYVITESVGVDPDRKVVIKLKEEE